MSGIKSAELEACEVDGVGAVGAEVKSDALLSERASNVEASMMQHDLASAVHATHDQWPG